MNLKKMISREILITTITVILMAVTFFGVSYAIYMKVETSTIGQASYGTVDFQMCTDSSCAQSVPAIGNLLSGEVYPMSDEEGLGTTSYSFIVKNTGNAEIKAYPYFIFASVGEFDYSKMKIAYKESTETDYTIVNCVGSEETPLGLVSLNSGQSKIINIKLWAGEEIENSLIGNTFSGYLNTVAYYFPNDSSSLHTITPTGTSKVPGAKFIQQFSYTGNYQTYTVPVTGWYNVELWGARGGSGGSYISNLAPKTSGQIYLQANDVIYVYVGGAGISNCTTPLCLGGYNGGGKGDAAGTANVIQGSGGGATDIRYGGQSVNDRIMVAAGSGGGSSYLTNWFGTGGGGGRLIGDAGTYGGGSGNSTYPGLGGTQITGGAAANCVAGTFGYGGTRDSGIAGGGGGYYGGGCGWGAGGGGGSSFISGYSGVNAITSSSSTTPTNNTKHYSNKYFINGQMTSGVNSGNGKAKITYIGVNSLTKTNTKLNSVRYIRDCINGSTGNSNSHWVELQAIYNGTNVAYGKTVTGTSAQNASYPYTRITDGDITPTTYATTDAVGLQCITVDLTQAYALDEISVWHYWADGRTYYSNTMYTSSDNSTWTPILASVEAETSQGKRVSAWDSASSVTPVFRISNIVTNGSFESGSTGWTPSNFTMTQNSTYKRYGNYSMPIVTANSTHAQMTQNVSIIAGNKYYGKVSFLRTGTLDNVGQYDLLGFTAGEMDFATSDNTYIASTGQWYDFAAIVNGIETRTVQLRKFTFSKVPIYTDGFTLINLTATFGSGKEPTKAWCDVNLNYFDSTQNFYLTP